MKKCGGFVDFVEFNTRPGPFRNWGRVPSVPLLSDDVSRVVVPGFGVASLECRRCWFPSAAASSLFLGPFVGGFNDIIFWFTKKSMSAYDFAQQNHIFPANDKNTARDVSVFVANVDSLDGLVEDQVRKLVNASQVTDECSSVS